MNDLPFSRWAPEHSALTIDYSQLVMEEIRLLVNEGFQRLARGGVEVGGVLFGVHDGPRVVIHAYRPVDCTYARGPQYSLSETDRQRFSQTVESHQSDPELAGLIPVGWYVSHTRSELALTDTDRDISDLWFPMPWQVLLILRPGRVGATRAGFILRDSDGGLRQERSLLEFNVDPIRPPAPVVGNRGVAPAVDPIADLAVPAKPKKHWIGAAVMTVLVLTALIAGVLYFYPPGPPPEPVPIALRLRDAGGEMRVSWNRHAPLVLKAGSAVLDISDEGKKRTVALTRDQLSVGEWPFLRTGGDVSVTLRVKDENGKNVDEVARFLGEPVKIEAREDSAKDSSAADALQAENQRLRKELQQERGRAAALDKKIAQLNELIRIERDRSDVFRKK